MIARYSTYVSLMIMLLGISAASCQNHAAINAPLPADSSYFPMRQFIKSQIHVYYGVPLSLYRIAYLDNKVDSTFISFFDMEWASILPTFLATDISDRKFLGTYACAAYDDETTGNRGYSYTATDPKAFTRLLQVNLDPSNNRITSIYIETAKHDFFGAKTQKLLYVPLHIIQIQETEHSLVGKARNLRVDYKFMQDAEVEQL